MDGVSLSWRSLPQALIQNYALQDRFVLRTPEAEPEIHFLYRNPRPLLPVWVDQQLSLLPWGQPSRHSRLPRTRAVAQETLQTGIWQQMSPELVEIPANFGWDKGIWYRIKEGLQGILVRDEGHHPLVYLLTEPATHYYQVMTRNSRMPVLCGERI